MTNNDQIGTELREIKHRLNEIEEILENYKPSEFKKLVAEKIAEILINASGASNAKKFLTKFPEFLGKFDLNNEVEAELDRLEKRTNK